MVTNGKLQLYPMLRIALFLVLGIVLGHELAGVVAPMAWLIALCALTIFSALFIRFPFVQTSSLLLAVTMAGATLASRQESRLTPRYSGEERVCQAVLVSEPSVSGKVVRCDLRVLDGEYQGHRVKASILRDTVQHNYRSLGIGDGIIISSIFEAPRRFGDSGFNYPLYLKSHGFSASTFVYWNAWAKVSVDLKPMSLIERTRLRALIFRQHWLSGLNRLAFNEEQMAVLAAMTMGEKSGLSKAVRAAYSASGASHVLALSGLHLGIIYGLLSLLFRFRRFRFIGESFILIAIWTYAFIVGLSPSVTRAATMITIFSLVGLLHRDRFSLNTLGTTAIIMLLVNPLSLYDVGFELSFVAVFFILLLYNPIYDLVSHSFLQRYRLAKWLWSLVAVSLAAQLGVAPLVMYYFGTFPTYFLLTNLVVIPLTTLILYAFVLLLCLSFLPFLEQLMVNFLAFLLSLQNGVLRWVATLPGAQVEGIRISALQVGLVYILFFCLFAVVWKLRLFRNGATEE